MVDDKQPQPTDNFLQKKRTVIWVKLPNEEPGVLMAFLGPMGNIIKDPGDAVAVVAMDRFERIMHFEIEDDTFDPPELH